MNFHTETKCFLPPLFTVLLRRQKQLHLYIKDKCQYDQSVSTRCKEPDMFKCTICTKSLGAMIGETCIKMPTEVTYTGPTLVFAKAFGVIESFGMFSNLRGGQSSHEGLNMSSHREFKFRLLITPQWTHHLAWHTSYLDQQTVRCVCNLYQNQRVRSHQVQLKFYILFHFILSPFSFMLIFIQQQQHFCFQNLYVSIDASLVS